VTGQHVLVWIADCTQTSHPTQTSKSKTYSIQNKDNPRNKLFEVIKINLSIHSVGMNNSKKLSSVLCKMGHTKYVIWYRFWGLLDAMYYCNYAPGRYVPLERCYVPHNYRFYTELFFKFTLTILLSDNMFINWIIHMYCPRETFTPNYHPSQWSPTLYNRLTIIPIIYTVIQGIPNHWEFRVSRWNLLTNY